MSALELLYSYRPVHDSQLTGLVGELFSLADRVLDERSTVNGVGAVRLVEEVVWRWCGERKMLAVDEKELVFSALDTARSSVAADSGVANAFGVLLVTLSTLAAHHDLR